MGKRNSQFFMVELSVCLHILPLAASTTLIILISEMFEILKNKIQRIIFLKIIESSKILYNLLK
jgi:hypothetical protein